jgi:hypothetical protein
MSLLASMHFAAKQRYLADDLRLKLVPHEIDSSLDVMKRLVPHANAVRARDVGLLPVLRELTNTSKYRFTVTPPVDYGIPEIPGSVGYHLATHAILLSKF